MNSYVLYAIEILIGGILLGWVAWVTISILSIHSDLVKLKAELNATEKDIVQHEGDRNRRCEEAREWIGEIGKKLDAVIAGVAEIKGKLGV